MAVKSVTGGDAECAADAKLGEKIDDVSSPSDGPRGEAGVSPSARAAAVAHLVDLGKQERGSNDDDDGRSTSSEETVPASPETLALGAGGDYSGKDGARVDGEEEEAERRGRVAGAARGAGKNP